jgi:hypothetical protein
MGLLELGCGISSRPDEIILRPDQVFLIQWDFLQTSSNGFTARPGLLDSVEFSSDQL